MRTFFPFCPRLWKSNVITVLSGVLGFRRKICRGGHCKLIFFFRGNTYLSKIHSTIAGGTARAQLTSPWSYLESALVLVHQRPVSKYSCWGSLLTKCCTQEFTWVVELWSMTADKSLIFDSWEVERAKYTVRVSKHHCTQTFRGVRRPHNFLNFLGGFTIFFTHFFGWRNQAKLHKYTFPHIVT